MSGALFHNFLTEFPFFSCNDRSWAKDYLFWLFHNWDKDILATALFGQSHLGKSFFGQWHFGQRCFGQSDALAKDILAKFDIKVTFWPKTFHQFLTASIALAVLGITLMMMTQNFF